MQSVLVGIRPPPPTDNVWKEKAISICTEDSANTTTTTTRIYWIDESLIDEEDNNDDEDKKEVEEEELEEEQEYGRLTKLCEAIVLDETINADSLVSSVSKTLGSDYSCELWACAPAPLPLKPLVGGYPIIIPKEAVLAKEENESWVYNTMKEWGIVVRPKLLSTNLVHDLRELVLREISNAENLLSVHRPEICIGKDTFHFREMASRGNERFDLVLLTADIKDFICRNILVHCQSLLEQVLGTSDFDYDISCVYSKPTAPLQGWHADGDHQKGATDAEWDSLNKLADPYAVCLFLPLIDLNPQVGFTQFWPGSHRYKNLMGFGPVADIAGAVWNGDCEMGDGIFYDYRLFHRGMPNLGTSSTLRPVLQIVFKRTWYVEKVNYGQESIVIQKDRSQTVPLE